MLLFSDLKNDYTIKVSQRNHIWSRQANKDVLHCLRGATLIYFHRTVIKLLTHI